MASPARLINEYLIAVGVTTRGGVAVPGLWPSYVGERPDGPNAPHEVVAIRDTRGRPDGKLMRSGDSVNHPGLQVSIRGLDEDAAASRIGLILWWLDRINRTVVTFNAYNYTISSCTFQNPIYIGTERETNRVRHLFVANGFTTLI